MTYNRPVPFQTSTFNILIASPSDLSEERKAAREAIHEWNDLHAEAEGVMLMPLMWETHAMPGAGGRPQEIINKQLVAKSDLLIGLFWTKMGTNTGVAESGTVEEINEIIAAGKPAMLYFSTRPINPQTIDVNQMQRLKTFRDETYRNALAGTFASPSELRQTLVRDLTRRVRDMKKQLNPDKGSDVSSNAMAESDQNRQRAETRWKDFDKIFRTGNFRGLLTSRVEVYGEGIPDPPPKPAYVGVSIVPLNPLATRLDIQAIKQANPMELRPPGAGSWHVESFGRALVRHNATRTIYGEASPPTSVVELNEDGAIFAAFEMHLARKAKSGKRVFTFEGEERIVIQELGGYTQVLRQWNVTGPLEVRITLKGANDAYLTPIHGILWEASEFRPMTEDTIYLDVITLDGDFDGKDTAKTANIIKPSFQIVWLDAGLPRDPCFKTSGEFISNPSPYG